MITSCKFCHERILWTENRPYEEMRVVLSVPENCADGGYVAGKVWYFLAMATAVWFVTMCENADRSESWKLGFSCWMLFLMRKAGTWNILQDYV